MIDLGIVILFVGWAVWSGLRAKAIASESLNEYFLAGQSLPGWKAGVSMAATQFAADTPLLVMGLIATGGIFMNWRLWSYGVAFLLMGFLLAKNWRRAKVLTDAEFTSIRYSGTYGVTLLRGFKAIYYGTVFNCVVLAMVLVAASRVAEVFLPWHLWLPNGLYDFFSSIVGFLGFTLGTSLTGLDEVTYTTNVSLSLLSVVGFILFYSTTGGLRSVVATDVAQFALAMIGTLLFAVFVCVKTGGLWNIKPQLVEAFGKIQAHSFLSFSPPGGSLFWPFTILVSVQWFFQINSDGTGVLAQRLMACKSERDARIAAMIFAWSQILVRSLLWLIIGVGLLLIYPFEAGEMGSEGFTALREATFIQGIQDLLPVGIKGMMLVGLLGALASTVDTHLNWGASYWSNDLYKYILCEKILKRQVPHREIVWVARLSNLGILLIGLSIMTQLGSIQKAWLISLLFGAGMGPVLVFRWIWERINLYSEVAAMATSLIMAVGLIVWGGNIPEYLQVVLVGFVSIAAVMITSLLTAPTDECRLKEFYERVKPSGFWRKTALACGDNPEEVKKEFFLALQNTAVASLSLFLILVGLGSILVQNPNQPILIAGVESLCGLALIPTWWKRV